MSKNVDIRFRLHPKTIGKLNTLSDIYGCTADRSVHRSVCLLHTLSNILTQEMKGAGTYFVDQETGKGERFPPFQGTLGIPSRYMNVHLTVHPRIVEYLDSIAEWFEDPTVGVAVRRAVDLTHLVSKAILAGKALRIGWPEDGFLTGLAPILEKEMKDPFHV